MKKQAQKQETRNIWKRVLTMLSIISISVGAVSGNAGSANAAVIYESADWEIAQAGETITKKITTNTGDVDGYLFVKSKIEVTVTESEPDGQSDSFPVPWFETNDGSGRYAWSLGGKGMPSEYTLSFTFNEQTEYMLQIGTEETHFGNLLGDPVDPVVDTVPYVNADISSVVLYTGNVKNTKKLTASAVLNGEEMPVTWISDNPDIVKVSQDGTLTALRTGQTWVYIWPSGFVGEHLGIGYSFSVTVKNPSIKVKKANKSIKSMDIGVGKSESLSIVATPKKAKVSLQALSASEQKIVSAVIKNKKLLVNGKQKGSVTLKLKIGDKIKKLQINVK